MAAHQQKQEQLREGQNAVNEHFAASLDTIINATGVGLWDWDLVNQTILNTGQLERLAGYEKGDLPLDQEASRGRLIYGPDRKRADATIDAVIQGKIDSYETEFRVVCKDGTIKWVQDRGAVAERDENGKATRIVGMFYDVNRFKQAEESLTKKVRFMDAAAGMSGLGTFEVDLLSGQTNYDEDLLRLFGYARQEAADNWEGLMDFLHPEDVRPLRDALANFLATDAEGTFTHQLRVRRRDGEHTWLMVNAQVTEWDNAGKPTRMMASCLDVDRVVRAEIEAQKALDEATRRSAVMFDANPHMSVILDDTFTPVDCNPAVLAYFGAPNKEVLLQNLGEVLIHSVPPYQPDGRVSVTFAQRMEMAVKEGYVDFETTLILQGREVPMRVIIKRIPYKGSFALAVYQVDMTDVKRNERALLRQDALLQAANTVATLLMETATEDYTQILPRCLGVLGQALEVDRAYVWQNEMDGQQLYASQLAEWVRSPELYLEYGERTFCYDDILPQWREMLPALAESNKGIDSLQDKLGTFPGLADVQSVLLLPVMAQGRFWGFLGFDDLHNAERVFTKNEQQVMYSAGMLLAAGALRAEIMENLVASREQARRNSRSKSEFLSRMSHEIRTPMNAIIGMTAIARKSDDKEKMRYCLEKIDGASRQMLDLINDVLDMSKIEAGKLEISSAPFDFEKMTQNVTNVVAAKMEEKNLELSFDFQDLFTRLVVCDELRLSQMLINLLGNAIKFTAPGGSVAVRVRHAPAQGGTFRLHVEVQDTGIGISPQHQQRLFSAFEQADVSTTREYGGTGLGLAICKSIAHLMGGDIWVQSVPGQGSTFIFEVDFAWGDELPGCAGQVALPSDMRILVVDDSEDVLLYFQNILEGFHLACDVANSGDKAVAMANSQRTQGGGYDVVFIDWKMPGMDGRQTAEALQRIFDKETNLVMISVADHGEVQKDLEELGIQHFLAKPVFPSSLYNMIVGLTSRHQPLPPAPKEAHQYNWRNKQVLLAEDIEINREIIRSLLADTGVNITVAVDGVEALETVESTPDGYDLILMDVQMPRMDGLTATKKIRQSAMPAASSVPIVAMTANAFKEDVDRCLAAGMNDHVSKPIDMDNLFVTLARYLGDDQPDAAQQ